MSMISALLEVSARLRKVGSQHRYFLSVLDVLERGLGFGSSAIERVVQKEEGAVIIQKHLTSAHVLGSELPVLRRLSFEIC